MPTDHSPAGTLFAIPTARGKGYIHYLGNYNGQRPICRVLPGLYTTQPDLHALAAQPARYTIHYQVWRVYALLETIERVGEYPIEGFPMPHYTRSQVAAATGELLWWIYDLTTAKLVKTTKTLTAKEKHCPPGGCIHPKQLVEWLEEDFTLEGWE